jgi:transcription elongation factor GreB
MTHYRPPRPKSSPYITVDGHQALQSELTFLWKEKRPEVTKKVAEAAAQGDRSENAEYIYGKRQLREIDGRIQFLSKRLDELTIVERAPSDTETVFFGAYVTLEDEQGEPHCFRIVGADEINSKQGYISIDAPLARAMVGKHVGDEVAIDEQRNNGPQRIHRPEHDKREFNWCITAIRYENKATGF